MENNLCNCSSRCREHLEAIRALDFAIVDTVLYLDAYPNHPEALSYYHALVAEKEKHQAAYEKNCGPMTIYSNLSNSSWDWVKGPWPWDPDAN